MLLTKSPRRHYMQIGYKNNGRKYNALPWSAQTMTLMNLSLRVQLAVNYARQQCSVENIQPWIYSVG